uniref:dihydrofolate reductase n=1 Tax=Piliocolobus tephrosceles TaxID=591936 RepID=A0A8C9H276_9PRIM
MCRKIWFSIPEKNRPLKDRINLVLSRELKEPPQGAHSLARSLDDILKLTEQPELANKVEMIWIVGGSFVYKEAMNHPKHLQLFVTRIMRDFENDTFFSPEIDLEKYKLLPEYPGVLSDVQEEKEIKFKFKYMRRMINMKMFSGLSCSPPSGKKIIYFYMRRKRLVDFRSRNNYF